MPFFYEKLNKQISSGEKFNEINFVIYVKVSNEKIFSNSLG